MDRCDQVMEYDMAEEDQDNMADRQLTPATSQTRQSLMNMRISPDSTDPSRHPGHPDLMDIGDLPEVDAYLVQVAHG